MDARSVRRAQGLLAAFRLCEAAPNPVGLPNGHGVLEALIAHGADAANRFCPDLSALSLFFAFGDIGGKEQV